MSSTTGTAWQRAEADRRAQAARDANAPCQMQAFDIAAPYNDEETAMIARIGAMPESRHPGALIGLLLARYRYRMSDVSYAHVKAAQIEVKCKHLTEVDATAGQEVIPW